MKRRRSTSRESVLARIHKTKLEVERLRNAGRGFEGAQAVLSDMVGNAYRLLDEPEATEWFHRSVAQFRALTPDSSARVALVLWKAGRLEEAKAECAEVIAAGAAALDREGSAPADLSMSLRLYRDVCIGNLLLGHFEKAEKLATEGDALSGQDQVLPAIASMAGGVRFNDLDRFDDGLTKLRGLVREWPSASSDEIADLLRYAQYLRQTRFAESI